MSDLLTVLHVHSLAQQLSYAFLAPCAALVFWRGGRTERWVMAAMVAAWIGTPFSHDLAGPAGVIAVDLLLLALLFWVALRSDRHWPMVATGLHVLGLVLHVAAAVDPEIGGRARVSASYIMGYLIVLSVVVGTIVEAPRRRRSTPPGSGVEPSV